MKQNELIKELLQNYYQYSDLERFFKSNSSYINDPMEYMNNVMKDAHKLSKKYYPNEEFYPNPEELQSNENLYNSLSEASVDLYSNGLYTGFQAGIDMAMVLMGCDPVYKALPETEKES